MIEVTKIPGSTEELNDPNAPEWLRKPLETGSVQPNDAKAKEDNIPDWLREQPPVLNNSEQEKQSATSVPEWLLELPNYDDLDDKNQKHVAQQLREFVGDLSAIHGDNSKEIEMRREKIKQVAVAFDSFLKAAKTDEKVLDTLILGGAEPDTARKELTMMKLIAKVSTM